MPVPPTQPRVWTPLPGRRGQTLRELPKLGIGLHTDVQQILIRSPRRTVSHMVPPVQQGFPGRRGSSRGTVKFPGTRYIWEMPGAAPWASALTQTDPAGDLAANAVCGCARLCSGQPRSIQQLLEGRARLACPPQQMEIRTHPPTPRQSLLRDRSEDVSSSRWRGSGTLRGAGCPPTTSASKPATPHPRPGLLPGSGQNSPDRLWPVCRGRRRKRKVPDKGIGPHRTWKDKSHAARALSLITDASEASHH